MKKAAGPEPVPGEAEKAEKKPPPVAGGMTGGRPSITTAIMLNPVAPSESRAVSVM